MIDPRNIFRPGPFYVSVIRPGAAGGYALALGPYPTHIAALRAAPAVRRFVSQHGSAREHFYPVGTCREESGRAGRLNGRAELAQVAP